MKAVASYQLIVTSTHVGFMLFTVVHASLNCYV